MRGDYDWAVGGFCFLGVRLDSVTCKGEETASAKYKRGAVMTQRGRRGGRFAVVLYSQQNPPTKADDPTWLVFDGPILSYVACFILLCCPSHDVGDVC